MATVTFLQPTNMGGFPNDWGGSSSGTSSLVEVDVHTANGFNAYLLGTFTLHGAGTYIGTITRVMIDDQDSQGFPNLDITGLSFPSEIDASDRVDSNPFQFVADLLAGDDTFIGSSGVDTILAFGGNDTLNGGGGADTMDGGSGNDTYFIENTADWINEAAMDGSDRAIVTASISYALHSDSSVELLRTTGSSSTYNVNLHGNSIANTIQGNGGANVLNGRAGNDVLTGFGGSDIFRFDTTPGSINRDTITDFNAAADTIQLQNSVFTALTTTGTLAAARFNTGAAATQSDDRIIYNTSTGALLYDADGGGGAAGIQFATLSTKPAITAADFVVI